MESRFFFLARYGEFTQDGRLTVVGGDYSDLVVSELPIIADRITLVTKLVLTSKEAESSHVMKFVVLDPDGKSVHEGAENTLTKQNKPPGATDGRFFAAISLAFDGVTFFKPGRHKFALIVDGIEIAAADLKVIVQAKLDEKTPADVAT